MKSEWIDYPFSIIQAAITSTIGGIFTLMLTLSAGTLLGAYALFGDWSYFAWPWVLLSFVAPICLACLQIWGFLYLALVMWFLYKLVFEDAPRLRICLPMLFAQFLCTITAVGILYGFDDAKDVWLRSIGIGAILLALFAAPFVWDARKRELNRRDSKPALLGTDET